MITFKSMVERVDISPTEGQFSNVVKTLHWRITATKNGLQSSEYGSIELPPPVQGSFVPFGSLTKTIVRNWVINALTAPTVTDIRQRLQTRISELETPARLPSAPPWNPADDIGV